MGIRNFLIEIFETIVTSIVILFILYMWVAMPEVVFGASMEPNFYTGERILVEKVTKHFRPYERGEVVVIIPPGQPYTNYIKRVIGLPGDVVKIMDCSVYIYSDEKKFVLQEDYLAKDTCTSDGPLLSEGKSVKIDPGYYLVLGDNREESADSRYFGFVPEKNIVGRVVLRFWPPAKVGLL